MRIALALFVLTGSMNLLAADLSREEAESIAARSPVDGGVSLSNFALARTRKEPNGEWSFLYECKPTKPDCHFLVLVNSHTGRVTTTSEIEERRRKAASARTEAALASTTKEACEANEGTWYRAGMAGQELCDIEAPDAGEKCSDSADCESACVVDSRVLPGTHVTGRCDKWHHRLGRCVAEVKNGVTGGALCVD